MTILPVWKVLISFFDLLISVRRRGDGRTYPDRAAPGV